MDRNPVLRAPGRRFALELADSSLVARVALAGYGAGWPDSHVATAVRAMNESGLADSRRRARIATLARAALVALYPCRDCGATAGAECRPEYGCTSADRTPAGPALHSRHVDTWPDGHAALVHEATPDPDRDTLELEGTALDITEPVPGPEYLRRLAARDESGAAAPIVALALAAVAVFAMLATLAIGRALDTAGRDYVTFTRDGVTLECERITDIAGRTFYDSCARVPNP